MKYCEGKYISFPNILHYYTKAEIGGRASHHSLERVERKGTLTNPGVLGSITTPESFHMDEHCSKVRSCNRYYVMYVKYTSLAVVPLAHIAILHR